MSYIPTRQAGFDLFLAGIEALSHIESYGIAVDIPYYKKQYVAVEDKIKSLRAKIDNDKNVKTWKRIKGNKFNMDSDFQLKWLLYDYLKIECPKKDREGISTRSVDKDTLPKIDLPFLRLIVKLRKLIALQEKIEAILRETVDGILHPMFNLHLVRTMRSSSQHINFQNQDVRDEYNAEVLRSGFLARRGRQIGESDFGKLEVCIAACYNHDPVLIEDITNPKKDMHRDMAAACYKLKSKEVTSEARYCGKNQFVFPEFYGDYYVDCARALWSSIRSMKLKTVSGTPLRKHLQNTGIQTYNQFERHVQTVEHEFWYERYNVYRKWKERLYERYLQCGYIDMLTGFRLYEILKRNEAINRPIQGSAFHCLLWTLIEFLKAIRKYKFKSMILGQIHDSLVNEYVPSELDDLIGLQQEIATVRLQKHWPWIIVPLELDYKVAPVGGNWHTMKKVKV